MIKKILCFSLVLGMATAMGVGERQGGMMRQSFASERLRAPDFSVTAKVDSSGFEIVATPPAGHHFNVEAPASIKGKGVSDKGASNWSLVKKSVEEIRFKQSSTSPDPCTLGLYLCDDANSFCEKHLVTASWDPQALQLITQSGAGAPQTGASQKIQDNSSPSKFGFLHNQPEQALATAKKMDQPLLIDFFGIWCPPCNQLDEEVFSTDEFKRESKNFIKLKLDADSEVSWNLKSKYKVDGYPTVVFAASNGEEIGRIVGFRSPKDFLKKMKEAWASRARPLSRVMEEAKKGQREALDEIGLLLFDQGDFEGAAKKLEKSRNFRERYLDAQIAVLEKKSKSADDRRGWASLLDEAIKEFPKTPESLDRRVKLAAYYASSHQIDLQKQMLGDLIKTGNELILKPSSLENKEMTIADLWTLIAEAEVGLGKIEIAKNSWKRAAREYQKRSKTGRERGAHLEAAYCLWKSGDFKAADQIYQRFEKLFPAEFTFYFNHARMKQEQKEFQKSEALARKALQYSYGDNKLRATLLLAQVLKAQGQEAQALRSLRELLNRTPLPKDPSIRTHRYIHALRDLEKDIASRCSSCSV